MDAAVTALLESMFAKMRTDLNSDLDSKLKPIQDNLEKLTDNLEKLKDIFEKLTDNFETFKGDVNERRLREKMQKV